MKTLTQTSKKLVLALVVSAAASQASAITINLISVDERRVRVDDGDEATSPFDISATTASWDFDGATLRGTGVYDVTFYAGVETNKIMQHVIDDLVVEVDGVASATSFECIEGNLGAYVGANICANTEVGEDYMNETTITYSGNSFIRTVGGDDSIIGPPVQLSNYDYLSHSWDGTTLVLTTVFMSTGGADRQRIMTFSAVPVPAAAWLFGSAILGLVGFNRKKTKSISC